MSIRLTENRGGGVDLRASLRQGFSFSGQSSRKAYWASIVLVAVGLLVIGTISGLLINRFGDWAVIPFLLAIIVAAVVLAAASVRRLHDLGLRGWWVLALLVPYVGLVGLVPLLLVRGRVCANDYGGNLAPSEMQLQNAARVQTRAADREAAATVRRQEKSEHRTVAAARREAAIAIQQQHNLVRRTAVEAAARVEEAQRSVEHASARYEELDSGRGAMLATAGDAVLHEFWLSTPGYSGPVAGASARVTQHGDVHSVSDVKGTTKGGLGGAVVGGALFGPAGAVVGATVRRKTTVETTVRRVDTREYELEVLGPGFAYSARSVDGESFRLFRDLLNAQGSSQLDIRDLQGAQGVVLQGAREEFEQASAVYASAQSLEADSFRAADDAWSGCLAADSSLWEKLHLRLVRARALRLPTVVGDEAMTLTTVREPSSRIDAVSDEAAAQTDRR